MNPSDKSKLDRADLEVPQLSFGATPIGHMFEPIDHATPDGMIQHAWDAGIR